MRAVLLIAAIAGCSQNRIEHLDQAAAYEAVLRWAFRNAESNLSPPAAYCVSYTRGQEILASDDLDDAPGEILDRFRESEVAVRPASACRLIGGTEHAVVDTLTGAYGLLFEIAPLTTINGTHRIRVGYMQGGSVGRGWECTVLSRETRWIVDRCETIFEI